MGVVLDYLFASGNILSNTTILTNILVRSVALGIVADVMEFVRDVPRVITLEKRPIRMRQFLDKIIQSSPNAIVVADIDGHILLMNQAAENLFGHSMEEAIRIKSAEDFYPPGKARVIMKKLKVTILAEEES